MSGVTAFVRKWRHRIDFLARETAYQAHGLAGLTAALAAAPREGGPILVLVAAPAQARFLARVARFICAVECETRTIADASGLETCLAEASPASRRVLIAGELYARFHVRLAPDLRAGRLAVA